MPVIDWAGTGDGTQKIGTAEPTAAAKLGELSVGDIILLRSELGEVLKRVAGKRTDGPYIELTFEPVIIQDASTEIN
jgi:hypothetical protein